MKRLTNYFVRSRQLMAGLISIVVAVTATALAAPSIQDQAIDAIKEGRWDSLSGLLIPLAAVYGLDALFGMGQSLLSARLSQRIVRDLRHDLFQKIDHLSIGYMDTHSNGDLMSRMTNDIDNVSSTISQSLVSLVSGVLTIVGTVAIMFFYCWQLTLISLVSVSVTVLFTKTISKPMRGLFRKRSATLGQLNGHAEEMISGQTAIAGAERVFQLMDQPDEDDSGILPMEPVEGRISFRHVNFGYVPGKPVLLAKAASGSFILFSAR